MNVSEPQQTNRTTPRRAHVLTALPQQFPYRRIRYGESVRNNKEEEKEREERMWMKREGL